MYAHREKKRGRAMGGGGFIVGTKKNWAEESNLIYKNKEGVTILTIDIREKKVIIISVYNRGAGKI